MTADHRLTRTLKILLAAALSIALAAVIITVLHRIIAVVIVVGGAIFFAYLVYPAVRLFSRRMPRSLAIICVYALFVAVIGSFVAFAGPKLASQARSLAQDFPQQMQQAQNALLSANIAIVAAIPIEARESVVQMIDAAGADLQKNAVDFAAKALTSLASIVTALVIIPILAFYILMDIERMRQGLMRIVPETHRDAAYAVLQDVDTVLGGFIRGQIIVGASVAILVTVMLLILQIKYALLIGVFAGIVDIIPYLGAIAGAVPAVVIALIEHGFGWALLVVAAFVVIYQAEGHVIAPFVVGQRVGLPPLMVIVAILTGAELGGILGMFVSVPLAGVIKALAMRALPPRLEELTESAQPTNAPADKVQPDSVAADTTPLKEKQRT